MKNDDLKRYLVQLRDILNQLITQPRESNIQKLKGDAPGGKNEVHIYLIPLILDSGIEELLAQNEESDEDSDASSEERLIEEEDLRYEITAFDKAFLKKWGIQF